MPYLCQPTGTNIQEKVLTQPWPLPQAYCLCTHVGQSGPGLWPLATWRPHHGTILSGNTEQAGLQGSCMCASLLPQPHCSAPGLFNTEFPCASSLIPYHSLEESGAFENASVCDLCSRLCSARAQCILSPVSNCSQEPSRMIASAHTLCPSPIHAGRACSRQTGQGFMEQPDWKVVPREISAVTSTGHTLTTHAQACDNKNKNNFKKH